MRGGSSLLFDSLPIRVGFGTAPLARAERPLADFAPGAGLPYGCLHEFYCSDTDDAAAAGLVACISIAARDDGQSIVWLRTSKASLCHGIIQGAGWVELGGKPESCLFVVAKDGKQVLRASHDAVRSAGVAVVIMEMPGRMPELDLTASRRLSLAAEKSGVLLLALRNGADPVPSAAETRWAISAAPSRALPANAPGAPVFDVELLRHRSGPAGGRWRMEWDRDQCTFREATLSGAVVPVPARAEIEEKGDKGAISNAA